MKVLVFDINDRGAAVGPKVCVIGELGVVRSGCRGLLWLSGKGGHVWVVSRHPLMIGGTYLSATLFRVCSRRPVWGLDEHVVVVVVVVFTLTDRASTILSNIRGCQSGTWSQRGTKVNGSHHGDNPLLRPTGIQIATKSYATLQAMAPTNSKTVHQTSFTPYREQPRSTRIVVAYPRPAFSATNRTNTFQPVLINNSKFLKATHRTKIRKIEIPRFMVVEALSC